MSPENPTSEPSLQESNILDDYLSAIDGVGEVFVTDQHPHNASDHIYPELIGRRDVPASRSEQSALLGAPDGIGHDESDLAETQPRLIPLKEVLSELRGSLVDANREDGLFELEGVSVELAAVIEESSEAATGLRWLVSIGSKESVSLQATHRVTLNLRPVKGQGADDLRLGESSPS